MCLEQWKDPPLGSLAEPGHAKFDSANSPSIVLDLSDKLGARVGLMDCYGDLLSKSQKEACNHMH
jgi:hypothetical protein